MKVLIEASEAYRNTTGIGRFSRALIAHLSQLPVELVYSPPDYVSRTHTVARRTIPARLKHFAQHVALTQVEVVRTAQKTQPNVIHSLSFFLPLLARQPAVATIFDLAAFDLPDETDRFWGAYARRMMPVFARRAAAIITTSDAMKTRICERFGLPPERVYRVYGGVDTRFRPLDAESTSPVLARYGLEEPYILYAGSWARTKNLDTLLAACAPMRDVTLVLTGAAHSADDEHIPRLAAELGGWVRFSGYVPDDELIALYNRARVVVLPSLYEGFGLPVVEAMACGAAVVVSDIPVLREVAGDGALTFPPTSVEALREVLLTLLHDDGEHARLRARGLARAKLFDWAQTAAEVVAVWQSVV